jgi:hypothetical protein
MRVLDEKEFVSLIIKPLRFALEMEIRDEDIQGIADRALEVFHYANRRLQDKAFSGTMKFEGSGVIRRIYGMGEREGTGAGETQGS